MEKRGGEREREREREEDSVQRFHVVSLFLLYCLYHPPPWILRAPFVIVCTENSISS